MRFFHYYHCYTEFEQWKKIADQHIDALIESNLDNALAGFKLGVVGSNANEVVKFFSKRLSTPVDLVAESPFGWEKVTLDAMQRQCNEWDYVLYAHTKGVSRKNTADVWRRQMTETVVDRWQECVNLLANYDAVGPFWLTPEVDPNWATPFFAGNFWWATSRYIQTLPSVNNNDRYDAERWLGLNNPSVVNYVPNKYISHTGTPPRDYLAW